MDDRKAGGEDVFALLRSVVDVLESSHTLTPSVAVVQYHDPLDLETLLDFKLGDETSADQLMDLISKTVKLSVRTSHPLFFNQLYGGTDPFGLAGAVVSEALNTSAYTHEVAPVFSLSEREVLKASLKLVGFDDGDGIFSPGGSISNMYGIVLSRFRRFPDSKKDGVYGLPTLVIYTSQDVSRKIDTLSMYFLFNYFNRLLVHSQSHYSVTKGANWLGLGTSNVVKIESDARGKMIPSKLEEAIRNSISEGKIPLIVNCTSGTTVLGAFDPLEEIAKICEAHGIWMHVDGLLKSCNMAGATYLFQPDKMYDPSYDSGDLSVQCGRKVDSFKLWTLWKYRGNCALGELVDHAVEMANYFLDTIRNRPGFRLVLDEFETTNVCFWFIPPRLRDCDETEDWWSQIHKVGPALKKKLVENGDMMIGYQPLEHRNLKNFFRMVVTCHPPRTKSDMDSAVGLIEKYGNQL
ncbi:unnamed protein product [Nesidiocoris tenuis]|uniref:Aminotransferase class V domain-containing protein n=2 Tax=Nesidiocoris tenuis TaxID=355587 RepID=A0A6H5HQ28_9HEMI|nr:unnamed protein product [Nesidiocoris tenuis]